MLINAHLARDRFAQRLLEDAMKGGRWLRVLAYENPRVAAVLRRWDRKDGFRPWECLQEVASIYVGKAVAKLGGQAAPDNADVKPIVKRGRAFIKTVDHRGRAA